MAAKEIHRRWSQAKAATATPEVEVIDAPAKKGPLALGTDREISFSLPRIRAPRGFAGILLLAFALWLWWISVQATGIFLNEFGLMGRWWYPFAVQAGFSAVERYFFAGVKNGLTITILVADGVINAAGLFIELLPRFFGTSAWALISTITGLRGDLTGFSLGVASVLLGIALAYFNDRLFQLATS
jgi:hypothetical protein